MDRWVNGLIALCVTVRSLCVCSSNYLERHLLMLEMSHTECEDAVLEACGRKNCPVIELNIEI